MAGMTEPGTVRLVLVGCSGLLGAILMDHLARQDSINVVASLDAASLLPETIHVHQPDVVLWNHADEQALADALDSLLPVPAPTVLAMVSDGREAALWQLRPRRTALGQLSPQGVVGAIRAAVAS